MMWRELEFHKRDVGGWLDVAAFVTWACGGSWCVVIPDREPYWVPPTRGVFAWCKGRR